MIWSALRFVTGGLTLVAFSIAAVLWFLKSRQDAIARVIARASSKDLPEILDTYLRGASVKTEGLSPAAKERIASSTIAANSKRYGQSLLACVFVAVLIAIVAVISIIWRPPDTAVKTETNLLRTVVEVIQFGIKDQKPYFLGRMSVSNIGPDPLLINALRLGVIASPTSDGSTVSKWFEMPGTPTIQPNGVLPWSVPNTPITEWELGARPSDIRPTFESHNFKFMSQVQATDARTGNKVWLDIDMPLPRSMNCGDHQCIAVFTLNVPAGASPYTKCTEAPAQVGWVPDCVMGQGLP